MPINIPQIETGIKKPVVKFWSKTEENPCDNGGYEKRYDRWN